MLSKSFKCHYTAFSREESSSIHEIAVPENELTGNIEEDLDLIFHYGQNEFKIKNKNKIRSLTAGDLIEFQGFIYLINDIGFVKEGEKVEKGVASIFLSNSKSAILHEKFPSIFE